VTRPVAQVQTPPTQVAPVLHTSPQTPQLKLSDVRSAHVTPQSV
jgi:hypothetical protein